MTCDHCGKVTPDSYDSDGITIPLFSGTCAEGIPSKRDFCREECLRDWLNKHLPATPKYGPLPEFEESATGRRVTVNDIKVWHLKCENSPFVHGWVQDEKSETGQTDVWLRNDGAWTTKAGGRETQLAIGTWNLPKDEKDNTQKPTIDPGEGYRLLQIGEERKLGDECWSCGEGPWKAPMYPYIGTEIKRTHVPHRRRIEPAILSAPDGVGMWEIHDPAFSDWITVDVEQSSDGLHATSKSTLAPIARWIKGGWTEWRRPATAILSAMSKITVEK